MADEQSSCYPSFKSTNTPTKLFLVKVCLQIRFTNRFKIISVIGGTNPRKPIGSVKVQTCGKIQENVAASGPGTGASDRSAYIVGDSAAEVCPETQERAAAMLDLQQNRPSQGSLPTEVCQE
jgi:hypothetical protein